MIPSSGRAQETRSPIRQAYDNCVHQSVAAQLLQLPFPERKRADHSMMIEMAFLACQTEERALGMILASIDSQRAPILMAAVKIQIKREIQNQIADPAAYRTAK